MNKAEPTLALKPRGDITRSPKQGYQWPYKKDSCLLKTFKKKKKKKTKQELEEVKSVRYNPIFTTAENTSPKKTVTFAKNTMPRKPSTKGKLVTKGTMESKPNKTMAYSATTSMSTITNTKIKMEPVSVIETKDTSDDNEGEDTENITEIDRCRFFFESHG